MSTLDVLSFGTAVSPRATVEGELRTDTERIVLSEPAMTKDEPKVSILIASHRAMSRESYAQALNHHAGIRVVACAATLEDALQAVRENQVDVALIASELGEGPSTGLLAIQQIKKSHPKVKSVLLFERAESHLVVPAFSAGAVGVFCPAADGIGKLCRCVKRVHEGQVWATSAQLVQMLQVFSSFAPLQGVDLKGALLLTKREEDIVRLVRAGMTNHEIAHELDLKEHTIANNLFRIFDKLGVSSRVELALYEKKASRKIGDTPSR